MRRQLIMKQIFILIAVIVYGLVPAKTFGQTLSQEQSDSIAVQSPALSFGSDSIPALTIEAADSAYIHGDYVTAAAMYEEIIATQGVSAALYMNLGNAYFKMNETAKSILNYERAYKLDPSDSDIRFNLGLARTRIVDKENTDNQFFIAVWINHIATIMNVNGWGITTVVLFALMALAIGIYFFAKRIWLKKTAFSVGVLCLFLTIMAFCFASTQKKKLLYSNTAIIMSPSITVKSTPNDNGTDLFIIHEGRKIQVLDASMKDWVEIKLDDGNEGWIPVSSVEMI